MSFLGMFRFLASSNEVKNLSSYIKFREKHVEDRFLICHPILLGIAMDMAVWFKNIQKPFEITSSVRTPEENRAVGGQSATHLTARAIDVASKYLTRKEIHDFLEKFNSKEYSEMKMETLGVNQLGAVDLRGKERLVVYHKNHFHVQIHSHFAIDQAYLKCPIK